MASYSEASLFGRLVLEADEAGPIGAAPPHDNRTATLVQERDGELRYTEEIPFILWHGPKEVPLDSGSWCATRNEAHFLDETFSGQCLVVAPGPYANGVLAPVPIRRRWERLPAAKKHIVGDEKWPISRQTPTPSSFEVLQRLDLLPYDWYATADDQHVAGWFGWWQVDPASGSVRYRRPDAAASRDVFVAFGLCGDFNGSIERLFGHATLKKRIEQLHQYGVATRPKGWRTQRDWIGPAKEIVDDVVLHALRFALAGIHPQFPSDTIHVAEYARVLLDRLGQRWFDDRIDLLDAGYLKGRARRSVNELPGDWEDVVPTYAKRNELEDAAEAANPFEGVDASALRSVIDTDLRLELGDEYADLILRCIDERKPLLAVKDGLAPNRWNTLRRKLPLALEVLRRLVKARQDEAE